MSESAVRPHLRARALWDRLGIGVSGLCAVHCLLMPVLLSALPLWPALHAVQAWLHPAFIVLLVPIAYQAARAARRGRRSTWVPLLLGLGLAAITLAWLGHDLLGRVGETAMTLAGSALLIAGHWQNWQAHRARCADA